MRRAVQQASLPPQSQPLLRQASAPPQVRPALQQAALQPQVPRPPQQAVAQAPLQVTRAAPALASAQAIAPLPKGVQGGRQAQDVAQVASVQNPSSVPRALPAQPYAAPAQTYAPPLQARAISPAPPPVSAPPQYQQAYQAPQYRQPQQQAQAVQDPELSDSSDEPADTEVAQDDPPPAYVVQTHTPPPQSAYTVQTYQTYTPPPPQSQPVQVVQYAPAYGQPIYVPRPPAQAMVQPVIMIGRPPAANYPGGYRRAYWARQYRRAAQVHYGYSVQPANYRGWQ
jgi:hypothetical protein